MSLGLKACDGISVLPFPQHDIESLVVLPPSSQVNVGIQEVTVGGGGGGVNAYELAIIMTIANM